MMTYWKNSISDKVSTNIKKEFDSNPVYDKKTLNRLEIGRF